jgi:DNA-directed RNA polymerase subunit RPC12/RpoP
MEGFVIKFRCKKCGQKIHVPETHIGKKGKCPKCSRPIVVPKRQSPTQTASQTASPDSGGESKSEAFGLTFLDLPEEDKSSDQRTTADKISEPLQGLKEELAADEAETVPERKLPWLIDIFLYPISTPGRTILAIIIVIPLLIDIVATLLGPFGFFVSVPGLVINIVLFLYMYWYLCECIRDSAEGGLRAPDVLVDAPSIGDMAWQTLRIILCSAFFFGAALIYWRKTGLHDTTFWLLLTCGGFFFPMGLLAVVIIDSFSGLNPILLIGSIFSTFLQYCGLVLLFCFFGYMLAIFTFGLPWSGFSNYIPVIVILYLLMVAAHLLGRFYWRYKEKLYWEV